MEKEEMIRGFIEFLRNYADSKGNKVYISKINDLLTVTPKKSLDIDWSHLNAFNPPLAQELIENPEEVLLAAEDAIRTVLLEDFDEEMALHARFYSLPQTLLVKELGAEHINRLIQVEGIITRISEVKPFVQKAVFVCKDCGNEMIRLQKPYSSMVKPPRCENCGSRNLDINVEKSSFINLQTFRLQDRPESLKGGQMPRFVDAILLDDLVDVALPGDRVVITGILRIIMESKEKRPIFKKILEVNHIDHISKDVEELDISPEDEQRIRELAKRSDVVDAIVDSIAPAIYGLRKEKLGIALALFGGVHRQLPDGTKLRGESHVLLVGDPGVAKCVDYDTLVLLGDGKLEKIGTVVESAIESAKANGTLGKIDDGFYAPIDLELYTLDATNLKVRKVKANIAWKRKAPERMYFIRTASGREIRVTPTHPFFTLEAGQFRTKKAKELRVGDMIAVPRRVLVNGRGINGGEFEIKKPKTAKSRLKLPEILNEEFWYTMGLLAGDGYAHDNGGSATVYFANNDATLIERVFHCFKNLGLNPTIREPHKGKGAREVYVSSAELYRLLDLMKIATNSKERRTPEQLFKAREEDIVAFLQGYFDAEGTVDKRRAKITIASASKGLLQDVRHLLLRLGIKSQLHETKSIARNGQMKNKKMYYRLFITGEDVLRFKEKVGFRIESKARLLAKVTGTITKNNINVDVIPGVSRLLLKVRHKWGLTQKEMGINRSTYSHYERGDRLPSREKLKKIVVNLQSRGVKSEELDFLKLVVDSDIFWDKIVEIKEYTPAKEWVYDLQVPVHHNFIANDIFVHNSQLLRYVANLAPRAIYTSGKSSSAAGLTAAAVRDELTGSWVLEAGVLVLADMGIACLHPDSRVLVNGKYLRVEELFDPSKAYKAKSNGEAVDIQECNLEVVSLDVSTMKSRKGTATIIRRKPWKGELVKIKLRSGNELTLTPDHWLIDGKTLKWREAGEFKSGDLVVAPLKLPSMGDKMYIIDILPEDWRVKLSREEKEELKREVLSRFKSLAQFNEHYNIPKDFLSGKSAITVGKFRKILRDFGIYEKWKKRPLAYGPYSRREKLKVAYITPEMAYFFGFLYGDGWVQRTGYKVRVNITQSLTNKKQIDNIKRAFASFYSGTLKEHRRKTSSVLNGNRISSEGIIFYINSPLLGYLYEYLTGENLKNIFKLDDEALKAFIAGALDSDGCVSIKKSDRGEVIHVEFLLSNNLKEDLAFTMLLRRFDVYARVLKGKGVNRIRITGREDVKNLLDAVKGYSVKVKAIPEMKHLVSSRSDKIPLEPVKELAKEIIKEVPATVLQEKGLWSTLYAYVKGRYAPSRGQLHKILERLSGCISPELKFKLEVLVIRDYFLDEVVSVERIPYEGYVYDLYVPNLHNFVAEGVIVHNCIDEFDKMSDRDRSAIHEALEQQSYHRNFELLLADGRKVKIGELVDTLIEKDPDRVIKGRDTEVLPVEGIYLLAYDLHSHKIVKARASRVSRHRAPKEFVKLTFSNGREITVTPEHPIMVWDEEKGIVEIPARDVKEKDLVLAVRNYPFETSSSSIEWDKKGRLPKEAFTADEKAKLGLIKALKRSKKSITVRDKGLAEDIQDLLLSLGRPVRIKNVMGRFYIAEDPRKVDLIPIGLLREVYNALRFVKIHNGVMVQKKNVRKYLGRSEFLELADEALREIEERRRAILENDINAIFKTLHPLEAERSFGLIKPLLINKALKDTELFEDVKRFVLSKLRKATLMIQQTVEKSRLISFILVERVETVKNEDSKWVYDVTVEPHNLFVSHGLVLHNSISISKAGITATLNSRTTVIAAANPKYGRFNRAKPLPEQLDLPPTLLSRFDLIFVLLDEPDDRVDSEIATHILKVRRGEAEAVTPKVPYDLLKKYIAYARKNIHPVLSREAMDEIKRYYVRMRKMGGIKNDDEGVKPMPITARQLEALIRLSEAHARMRLSDVVTREDAKRAIDIMEYTLKQVATDESGEFDISILEVGKSSRQINKIERMITIIKRLENTKEWGAPREEIIKEAVESGMEEDEAERLLERLFKEGQLYSPRDGYYRVA